MQRFLGKQCLLCVAVTTAMAVSASDNTNEYGNTMVFDQMVVTATKTANSVAEAPASMSVITAEDIQAQPGMALNDMVEQAVGVESRKEGGRAGRETISIRGMDSDYTLIMVNGRKMNSSNAIVRGNDFDLSTIPKENIERIEIIRGPMSALYGSEALGGVVNIITRLPDNQWRSTVSTDLSTPADGDGGEQGMIGLNTGGALVADQLYLNLAVNKSDRKAWTPWNGDNQKATAREERDTLGLAGTLNWYINDVHSLDFDLNYSDDRRDGLIRSSKGLTPTNQEVKRHSFAITHNAAWAAGDSQLRLYREEVEISEKDFDTDTRDEVTETTLTLDGSFSTELGAHRLTIGGEVRKSELENQRDLPTIGSEKVTQEAFYVQDEWQLAQDWTLTYGTRVDHHETFGTEVSPRAYLVHNLTDNLTIKGGVGTAFKAPSLLQLNSDYGLSSCKGTCQLTGNPDLQPETSTSYELAANYRQNNWEVEAALFRNDVKDLIDRDLDNVVGTTSGGLPIYTYKNINKARIQGVELGGRIALSKALTLSGDLTFTDAKDQDTDQLLNERPRQTASVKLNWKATDRLNAFVRASYTGDQQLNETVEEQGYALLDIGTTYDVTDSTKLRGGISNVGNKGLSLAAEQLGYSEDPRTFYIGVTTTF